MFEKIKKIAIRELRLIFGDIRIATLLFIGPFFYVILFGFVYFNGRTSNVPFMIIDRDNSTLSRQIGYSLGATEGLKLIGYGDNIDQFISATRQNRANLAVVFPENFERDIKRGNISKAMIYSDESNLLIGNVTYRTIRAIFSDYRQKLKKQSQSILQVEYRALFNPTYNYDVFMLMGLAGVAVHQIFLIAFALAILLDAEGGKYKRYLDNPKEGKNLFFGKIFAFILISIPLGLVVISLPFVFFFAPMKGSIILFVFISIIFILSLVFASFGLAGSFLNPLLMMQTMLPLSPILFLISGYSWPLYLMPRGVSFIAHLLPLTYFLDALRRLTLTGASFADISLQFLALAIWMCFAFIWGIWGFNRIFKKVTD